MWGIKFISIFPKDNRDRFGSRQCSSIRQDKPWEVWRYAMCH